MPHRPMRMGTSGIYCVGCAMALCSHHRLRDGHCKYAVCRHNEGSQVWE
jgi:hypothetical protein